MAAKSVAVAYILWFFLGWFGVHQFYLRRDRHAFFTFATLGGLCGIGWLRDLFVIPRYVADANEDDEAPQEIESNNRPNQGFFRWAASLTLGYLFALLAYLSLWREGLNDRYQNALAIFANTAAGLGVFLVSGEGRQRVPLKWCLLPAWATLPFTMMHEYESVYWAALASSSVAGYKTEWRPRRQRTGLCRRVLGLSFMGLLYVGALTAALYYNASITNKGETVPLRDAVQNFFNSPAWKEAKETLTQLYNYYKHHGIKALWDDLVTAFDPHGESHAYTVLGVSSTATQKEIKAAYKALALKYHPDKEKDPEKKQEVANQFMVIQKAYDTLSKLKQDRSKKTEL